MQNRSPMGVTGTSYSLCTQLAGKLRIGVTEQSRVSKRFLVAVYVQGSNRGYTGEVWRE